MAAENQLHVTFRDEDIESLRKQMLSFARLQLDDEHLAEDAVQEALAGALKNASSFSRQSTLKTWVFCEEKLRMYYVGNTGNRCAKPVRNAVRTTTNSLMDVGIGRRERPPGAGVTRMNWLITLSSGRCLISVLRHCPQSRQGCL